jgi:hypothetical protein
LYSTLKIVRWNSTWKIYVLNGYEPLNTCLITFDYYK